MIKKQLCCLLCALAALSAPLAVSAAVPDPAEEISGVAAVLMDADTGQVLYEKGLHERMQPASITKILTGILVLENLAPETVITASADAVDIPYWGSSAYLQAGEQLTVDEAMHAMMLRSANDAANVLAEAVAESLDDFAQIMNDRAAELGARDTHFVNANGLPDDSHLTTAYDMALITRQAIATPGLLEYMSRTTYEMDETNLGVGRFFTNTHRMLLADYSVYNEEVIAGKTGYTTESGYTLATVARRGERTLICVILDSGNYYADTQALLDFGFTEFSPYTLPLEPPAEYSGTERIEIPIWNGDWEAGRAFFYPPQSTTLLLHRSVRPEQITAEITLPDSLQAEEPIRALTALRSVAGTAQGLPQTLLEIPWEVEVMAFSAPNAQGTAGGAARAVSPEAQLLHLAVGIVALALALLFAAALVWNRRRKRRSRLQRSYHRKLRRYQMEAHR